MRCRPSASRSRAAAGSPSTAAAESTSSSATSTCSCSKSGSGLRRLRSPQLSMPARAATTRRTVAPCPTPSLSAMMLPAVQIDEPPDDREPEAKARAHGRRRALPERLEHVRQELPGRCPRRCRSRAMTARLPFARRRDHDDAPAARRVLHRVRQQVPRHLLQTMLVADHRQHVVRSLDVNRDFFRGGRRPESSRRRRRRSSGDPRAPPSG